ncbi:MAG: class I SAM-dependent methyltransferase [Anaerolineales bacterium]|nr:class I SAM-dependent methyltransferase [Anaerolineales bacterium]
MKRQDLTGWTEETSRIFIDYGRFFIPQRDRQFRIVTDLLSNLEGSCNILELCCGDGLLAKVILETYSTFNVYGLDGSPEMLKRAGERLASFGTRFQSDHFELGSSGWRKPEFPVQAVVSSMAIHHLKGPKKQELFIDVYRMIADGGVFIISDVVEHTNDSGRLLAAKTLDEVVLKQCVEYGDSKAFDFFQRDGWNIYWYLDPEDIDKPTPLFDQLKWLESAGFEEVDVHWMLAGHAVFSAQKKRNGKGE